LWRDGGLDLAGAEDEVFAARKIRQAQLGVWLDPQDRVFRREADRGGACAGTHDIGWLEADSVGGGNELSSAFDGDLGSIYRRQHRFTHSRAEEPDA
jgi:hypothetical protein